MQSEHACPDLRSTEHFVAHIVFPLLIKVPHFSISRNFLFFVPQHGTHYTYLSLNIFMSLYMSQALHTMTWREFQYVWLTQGWYEDRWWEGAGPGGSRLNCSSAELQEFLYQQRVLGVNHFPYSTNRTAAITAGLVVCLSTLTRESCICGSFWHVSSCGASIVPKECSFWLLSTVKPTSYCAHTMPCYL